MIDRRIQEITGQGIAARQGVGGGCINNTQRLTLDDGSELLLKTNASSPPGMFTAEAAGLSALKHAGALRVPAVLAVEESPVPFLLMEYLAPAPRRADFWEAFGRGFARLHGHRAARFGFEGDNYIGATPQSNRAHDSWLVFFREERLLAQRDMLENRGLLDNALDRGIRELADCLDRIVAPDVVPALLHGDLWSGNFIVDENGGPALIDPAAYYGAAEADLAMTELFGRFDSRFYAAYEEVRPLPENYPRLRVLYNLYHLLNHLNLFGRSYHGGCMDALRALSGE